MDDIKKGLSRKEFLKTSAMGAVVAGAMVMEGTSIVTAQSKATGTGSIAKWAMVIDLDRCVGCKACAVACKTEFDTRLSVFRSQVIDYVHGEYPNTKRDFLPWLCNHCQNPPCVSACPVAEVSAEFRGVSFKKRATYKRPDGVVLVDQNRCIGCGECIRNCPYQVRSFDPGKRAGGDAQEHPADKCTFCEHRVAAGIVPSCVNTCQGRARIFGDINDSNSEVSRLLQRNSNKAVLLPNRKTGSKVYYIGRTKGRVNEAWSRGIDLRKEANSQYQARVYSGGK